VGNETGTKALGHEGTKGKVAAPRKNKSIRIGPWANARLTKALGEYRRQLARIHEEVQRLSELHKFGPPPTYDDDVLLVAMAEAHLRTLTRMEVENAAHG
jgi:hypothetical protein